jgi:hypothetical protein
VNWHAATRLPHRACAPRRCPTPPRWRGHRWWHGMDDDTRSCYQPVLQVDLEQAEVGVRDVQVPGLLIEAEPERVARRCTRWEGTPTMRSWAHCRAPASSARGHREGDPPLVVPEVDPTIGDARVRLADQRVKTLRYRATAPRRGTTRPHLSSAEPLSFIPVRRHPGGIREFDEVRLEPEKSTMRSSPTI